MSSRSTPSTAETAGSTSRGTAMSTMSRGRPCRAAIAASIGNSLFVSLVSMIITVALAFVYAYGLTRTLMRWRGLFRVVAMLPLFAPSLVQALAFIYVFGNNGIVTRTTGVNVGIYGAKGIVAAEVFYCFPHALLILVAALSATDARLYDAARTLGASPLKTFLTVTLPGVKFGLVSACFVVFTLVITDFGAPKAIFNGQEVGATRGIIRSLHALLREPDVTHVGDVFDTVIESFRNDLFDGYKTSFGVPDDLMSQFPLAERATEALGMVTWRMIEFEADDALAAFAARAAADERVDQVVICSPDKDLRQCVRGNRVICLDRLRKTYIDEPGVVEKFGIPPASIPDWLALVGDDADGIPGVTRWGARSAAAVLAYYHHVENIPDHAIQWKVNIRGATGGATLTRITGPGSGTGLTVNFSAAGTTIRGMRIDGFQTGIHLKGAATVAGNEIWPKRW